MGDLQFSAQQAGQPDTPSTSPEGAPEKQSQTVLPPEFYSKVGEIVKEQLSTYSREQQSQRDKMEARIRRETESRLAAVRNAFGEVTPEQEKAITNATRDQLLNETPDTSNTTPAQGKEPEKKGQDQPSTNPLEIAVNNRVNALYEKMGLTLEDTDPEAQGIDNTDAFSFVSSVERALEAKKQRLEQSGQPQKPPQTNVHTGGGGNTPVNPIANITDPNQLWEMAKKKR